MRFTVFAMHIPWTQDENLWYITRSEGVLLMVDVRSNYTLCLGDNYTYSS